LLESRPNGAKVKLDGVELTETVDGVNRPLVTPLVIAVNLGQSRRVELSYPGHDLATATLNDGSPSPMVLDLLVRPVVDTEVVKRATGGLAIEDSLAILGSTGQVVGFDLKQGSTRFTFQIDGLAELLGDPVVVGNLALCPLSDGRLVAISTHDGGLRWSKPIGRPVRGGMLHKNGYLYWATETGVASCLHMMTGEVLWTAELGAMLQYRPALSGTRLFVMTGDRQLLVMRSDSGAVVSRVEMPSSCVAPLLATDERLFLAGNDGIIHCLHQTDGSIVWSYRHQGGDGAVQMVATHKSILVGTADGRLAKMRVTDGKQEASGTVAGSLLGPPCLAGEAIHVLINGSDGRRSLLALTASDLSLRWQCQLTGIQPVAPVRTQDTTFILTDSGRLLGFQ
jgi:outer membrane protein assembly factor BamB